MNAAIREYRRLIRLHALLAEAEQWTLGAEIKAAKIRAYVEIEAAQVRR